MSQDNNVTSPDRKKRILLIAANPAVSATTGWPIGFWWAEPYWAFTEAGYEVEIRSPQGGKLEADGFIDPEHESGYSAHDILSLGFKKSPSHAALLDATPPIAGVDPACYDAVFLAGGQSPMFTFRGNSGVQRLVARFFEAGRVTALVCHATCLLLETRLSDGRLLAEGRTWTGFADSEERFADGFAGTRVQPFWIEEEARRIDNTNFVVHQRFRPFAVRDPGHRPAAIFRRRRGQACH
jgi:putative intracellular protease/amidase